VLETTGEAMRDFLSRSALASSRLMVSFPNDDDFVFFHVPQDETPAATDAEITELTAGLKEAVSSQIERVHGEDIAALFDIFVGRALVIYNPKLRLERQIYRGIREAANASKSLEHREQAKKVADLRETLRDRGLYIEYHPIVITDSQRVFGYEALARGTMRSMRSPEVMFEIAVKLGIILEMSRLWRICDIEGIGK